ncbi:MAG: DeoR/GlpR transcriptional regulator [Campylobacterales bacterium]|nr:DeoR/GlpR transcriptional regulator [Campylobacterales bacterium]
MARYEKRRIQMIQRLERVNVLYLNDMANHFNVSKETIRQDFDALSELETIERIHGGIRWVKKTMVNNHYIFEDEKMKHIESKKAIAYKALSWIEDGSTIFLDTGSTVACLFQYLNFKKKLIVITASIPLLFSYLEPETKQMFQRCAHQFIFVGGHVNCDLLGTYGPFFDQMVGSINIDVLFFSGDAFDLEKGLSNTDEVAFSLIQTLKEKSLRLVALVDHSKVGKLTTFQCLTTKSIDVLITDYEFSSEDKGRLEISNVVLNDIKTSLNQF